MRDQGDENENGKRLLKRQDYTSDAREINTEDAISMQLIAKKEDKFCLLDIFV